MCRHSPRLALSLLVLLGAPVLAGNTAIDVGQPLSQALAELSRHEGLATVYTSEVVRPSMRVVSVPQETDPLIVRAALLAQHGLRCRSVHVRCVVERGPDLVAPERGRIELPTSLDRVDVWAGYYGLAGSGAGFLDDDDVAALPHFGDDTLRLARVIPGVAASDSSARFHVRGGETDAVSMRLDGFELYRPFHLASVSEAIGIIDANLVGAIDLYTGAWPSRFGGRNGAVMDVSTREVEAGRDRRIGVGGITAFYTHGWRDDDHDRDLLASVRRGYLDFVLDYVDPDGEIDPAYRDVLLRWRQPVAEGQRLTVQMLSAGDDVVFDDADGDRERLDGESGHHYFWARLESDWSNGLASETVIGHAALRRERAGFLSGRLDANAVVRDHRELAGWRFSHATRRQTDREQRYELGLEWRAEEADYDYRSRVEVRPIARPGLARFSRQFNQRIRGNHGAAWLDYERTWSQHWSMRSGLRVAHFAPGERSDTELDAHLALAWSPLPERRLRLSAARATQGQRSDELAVEDGEERFAAPEPATQIVLAWEEHISRGLDLRAEVYALRWNDPRPRWQNLFFGDGARFPEAEPDRVRVDPERARSAGLELTLSRRHSGSRWWASYALSRAEERLGGVWQPRSWDQPHSVQLGYDREFGEGWRLSTLLAARSGWPTTPLIGEHQLGQNLSVRLGERNSARVPHYLNLAARLSRDVRLANSMVTAYFEVFNLLNRDNPTGVSGFDIRVGERDLVIQPRFESGLPIVPSIGVIWRL